MKENLMWNEDKTAWCDVMQLKGAFINEITDKLPWKSDRKVIGWKVWGAVVDKYGPRSYFDFGTFAHPDVAQRRVQELFDIKAADISAEEKGGAPD